MPTNLGHSFSLQTLPDGGLLLGQFAAYPETMADSAIAEAEVRQRAGLLETRVRLPEMMV